MASSNLLCSLRLSRMNQLSSELRNYQYSCSRTSNTAPSESTAALQDRERRSRPRQCTTNEEQRGHVQSSTNESGKNTGKQGKDSQSLRGPSACSPSKLDTPWEPVSNDNSAMSGSNEHGPCENASKREGKEALDSPGTLADLTNSVETKSQWPITTGGFSDLYRGELRRAEGGSMKTREVAIKVLRVWAGYSYESERARKRLNREVYVWSRLQHPNIAELYGTSWHMGGRPAMIMRWYKHGTVLEYIRDHPEVQREKLVRDVARGLAYLHGLKQAIVHGDLKAGNVLVFDEGYAACAVICDFGLARVLDDIQGTTGNTTESLGGGSLRWKAPELITFDLDNPEEVPEATKESDVWAFGCTAFETLTGEVPYRNRSHDWHIMMDIWRGAKPARRLHDDPDGNIGNALWDILDRCWEKEPSARPQMATIFPGDV